MSEDNKLNISKEEIFAGKIKDETVSEMAKMTAKQIYWQGVEAGKIVGKEEVWNEAIEAAAIEAKRYLNSVGYKGVKTEAAIRGLKK